VNKNAPSIGRLITMVAFAASCFAILLYLWLTFGGSVPLKAKQYEIAVAFPEATTLAQEADVRIAGVKIGTVKTKELDEKANATRVTIAIDPKYAPLPMDTRAILRQKTLLGETYVELTPARCRPARSRARSSSTRSSGRSTSRRAMRSGSGSTSRARRSGRTGRS
jgi:ABC-type transporter Mla subunit MlaD